MARKELGYVELEWTCKRCETKNPGTARVCSNCGAPMETGDSFQNPAEAKLIKDPDQLAAAGAGPDRHCPYCGTRNPVSAASCAQCGGDLREAQARQAGQVVGAFLPGPAAQRACPACGKMNPAGAARCLSCGASLSPHAAAPAASPSSAAQPGGRSRTWIGLILGGALVFVCMVLLAVFALSQRTTGVLAQVEGVRWERSIQVLEQRPVRRETWEEGLPQGAARGGCELRYRTTSSEPAPQSTEVCGTPYTEDQGSGLGKVVQDCQYRVYDSWCSYTVKEWQVIDTRLEQGSDLAPSWPGINLVTGQREGERGEVYSVTLASESGGKTYTYQAGSLEEFLRFTPGSRWELLVNAFGSVTGVNPKE